MTRLRTWATTPNLITGYTPLGATLYSIGTLVALGLLIAAHGGWA